MAFSGGILLKVTKTSPLRVVTGVSGAALLARKSSNKNYENKHLKHIFEGRDKEMRYNTTLTRTALSFMSTTGN